MPVRIEDLEGWLLKVKNQEKSGLLSKLTGGENKRWFRVMELSTDRKELILCYFRKRTDRDSGAKGKHYRCHPRLIEGKGWIYLEDVLRVVEGEGNFTLFTSSRTMTLQAPSKAEHKLWLQGIAERCAQAVFENIKSSKIRLRFFLN